jgi:sensor histidine kinase YesM
MCSLWRVVGVVIGCLYILVVQLVLYDHSSHMLLMMPLIALGLAFGARLHVMEKVGAGVGFASITTIGIMFGQNMHPDGDLVFSDLYRIVSVTVALVATLTMVFLVHLILNRFEATRYIITPPEAD